MIRTTIRSSQFIIFVGYISMHCTIIPIAPATYVSAPVRRTTLQIMQGQVAETISPSISSTLPKATSGIASLVKHFKVADYQETGQYGPSAETSVGSKQIVVASKGRIRSFLRDGRIDNALNLSHDSFFSPISLGGFTADPNVIFHPIWKQWILFANAFLVSSTVLAISDGDPITSSTIWTFYVVDTASNSAFASPSAFFDYTTLGADAQAIYCAVNVLDFNNPSSFSSAAYVIPKTSLNSTTAATIYAFRNLRNLGPKGLTPFTLQPALNFDANPPAGYFASINYSNALAESSNNFLLQKVTYGPAPTLSDPIEVPVVNYVLPIVVNALGTPPNHSISPVASFRLSPAHIRDNRLWLVNNIGVDNNGASDSQQNVTRNGARFTQIDVTKIESTPAAAAIRQGTLFQRSSGNNLGERSFLTPSIMSNAMGKVIIGATTCASNERLNAAFAQLIDNDTAVGPALVYTQSTSNYDATEDWEFNPFARWGDHTRISADPINPEALWSGQLWCSEKNTWAIDVAHIVAQ